MKLELRYEKDRDLYNALRELGFDAEYNNFTTVRLKSYGVYKLLSKIIDKPAEEITIKEEKQAGRVITDFEGIKAVLYAIEMANTEIQRLEAELENRNTELEGLKNRVRELENVIESIRNIMTTDC